MTMKSIWLMAVSSQLTAVDVQELHSYRDVIIFATVGSRSPLSLLGGGDYDGDTVTVIFEPTIVSAFVPEQQRADGLCSGDPPPGFVGENFEKASEIIQDFLATKQIGPDSPEALEKYRRVLLSSLQTDMMVGRYSIM